jgi:hypothetical protein
LACSKSFVIPATSAALYPACCWKRVLRVTLAPELAVPAALLVAALEELAAPELELELEPPQAARYIPMLAVAVVVMKPRRVVRFCSGDIWTLSSSSNPAFVRSLI